MEAAALLTGFKMKWTLNNKKIGTSTPTSFALTLIQTETLTKRTTSSNRLLTKLTERTIEKKCDDDRERMRDLQFGMELKRLQNAMK